MLYVITGPPAAGKSTWVRAHARPGDVVIDYDLLAAALTVPDPGAGGHDHRGPVRATAFRARGAAIREALRHVGKTDVYIIHSQPPADALATYTEHGAELVVVDPGRDVVFARIAEQRPASARAVAERWYSQHASTPRRAPAGRWQGRTGAAAQAPAPRTSRTW